MFAIILRTRHSVFIVLGLVKKRGFRWLSRFFLYIAHHYEAI